MTQHAELIAQLKALGIPDWATARWLMAKAAEAIEALESQVETLRYELDAVPAIKAERDALQAEVERLKALAVMEFNEDKVPSFTQGYHPHELTTVVTADRCSVLVKMITDLRARLTAAQTQRDEWKESTELANVRFKKAEAQLAAANDSITFVTAHTEKIVAERNALDVEATRLAEQITETKGIAVKVMAERDALQVENTKLHTLRHEREDVISELRNEVEAQQAQLAAAQQVAQGQLDMWVKDGDLIKELRAQLAAAQEQKPVAKCTWGGRIEHLHEGPPSKLVGVELYAAPIPQQVAEPSYAAIHMEHCFQPPYETSCKYGDDDCPAQQAQPERAPLSDVEMQEIHNQTGAGHALICLVEAYITGIKQGGQHE